MWPTTSRRSRSPSARPSSRCALHRCTAAQTRMRVQVHAPLMPSMCGCVVPWLCLAVPWLCLAVPCRAVAVRRDHAGCSAGSAEERAYGCACHVACSVACSVACCVSYAMRRGQAVQYANQQKYRSARARTDHLHHGCPSARHRPQLWWWVDVAGKASPKCTLSKTAVRFSALYRPL